MAHTAPLSPSKRPKKRSNVITLSIIGAVSVLVVGHCAVAQDDDEVTADCVDMNNQFDDGSYQVVDESYCDEGGGGSTHYGGSHGAYLWYYGGTRVGTHVRAGTTYRPSEVNITSRAGREIQRGGFGGSRGGGG